MRLMRDMFYAGLFAVLPLAAAPALAEDAGAMALALAAADSRDWVTARDAALRAGPLAEAMVGWQALRAGHGSFADYAAFLRENPGWPGLESIYRQGEAKLRAGDDPDDIRDWFENRHPTTLSGLNALTAVLSDRKAKAERALFLTLAPMTAAEETALLDDPETELTPLIPARATAMLDAGEWEQAERLIPRLSPALQPLVRARVALQSGRQGVDDLILALPEGQRADAGLTMDRFLWRVRAKMHDAAQDLMLQASTAEDLRNPDRWAQMRVDYARLAMRQGQWQRALDLAAPHHLDPDNRHYSDLEWLAGFAALKTGQPQVALDHFLHLETVVGSAISKARAFYWQGRAHQALGDTRAARRAFEEAAAFPGVYYGQLAMEQVGTPLPPEYAVTGPAIDTLPDWRGSDLRENGLFRAGLWLIASGRRDEAQRFFLHAAQTAEPEDIARMSRLMFEAGAPWHALRLAKQSANQGVIWPAAQFPLTGLENRDLGPPPELVMAIARQESEFNFAASSHVGAQGLMQLMPGTAEQMARKLDLPYDLARLSSDAAYNASLGSAYLMGLEDRFGSSVALIASGYNAGPGRPARWLDDFGDLRRDADPVEWVELIPFDETRNYVMRVAEALPVYRARIHGKPAPVVTRWDLSGGGLMPPPPLRLTLALSGRPPARPVIGPRQPVFFGPNLPSDADATR